MAVLEVVLSTPQPSPGLYPRQLRVSASMSEPMRTGGCPLVSQAALWINPICSIPLAPSALGLLMHPLAWCWSLLRVESEHLNRQFLARNVMPGVPPGPTDTVTSFVLLLSRRCSLTPVLPSLPTNPLLQGEL